MESALNINVEKKNGTPKHSLPQVLESQLMILSTGISMTPGVRGRNSLNMIVVENTDIKDMITLTK